MAQIENEIKIVKQKIISVLIIFFMFVMVFSIVKVGLAANQDTTSLAQNITAGTLDVVVNTTLEWASIAVPLVATNSNADFDGVNVADSRGSYLGWGLTVYANNLEGAGGNKLDIENRLYIDPGDVTTTSNASAGSAFYIANNASQQSTFMTATVDNGWGGSNIDNSAFKLRIEPTDSVANYTATMTFTVS